MKAKQKNKNKHFEKKKKNETSYSGVILIEKTRRADPISVESMASRIRTDLLFNAMQIQVLSTRMKAFFLLKNNNLIKILNFLIQLL